MRHETDEQKPNPMVVRLVWGLVVVVAIGCVWVVWNAYKQEVERTLLVRMGPPTPELAATLRRAKEVIPPELRYGDTFWTAITLVGDLRDGNNHIHKDLHDVVSLIVMVGKDITGGATHYYDDTGKVVQTVPFEHGRYQVCEFDKVWHAGEQWQGKRGIISFYLNREIMEHFARYGTAKYEAARERLYA